MRSIKKHLSFCIIIAMLASLLVYPPVFGDETISTQNQSGSVLLTEDFEGTTNAFDANVSNVIFDGVTGKVGAIAYNNSGNVASILDFEDVTSGGVKVSYDAYLLSNGNRPVIASPAEGGTSTNDYDLLQVFQRQIRLVRDATAIYTASANGWVRIEQFLNLDAGTVTTKVSSMDGTPLAEATNDAGCDSIGKITFRNWGKSSAFHIDNILIETYDPVAMPTPTPVPTATPEPSPTPTPVVTPTPTAGTTPAPVPVPTILITEDFEGATNALDANCTNETHSGKNVGEIYKKTAVLDIDDVYSGAIKISLDYYAQNVSGANPDCTLVANAAPGAASTADCSLVQIFQARVRKIAGDNIYSGNSNPGQWYHLEQFINLDSGVAKTFVYDASNVPLAEGTETVGCSSVGSISFNSVGSLAFYMDNVKVETIELSSIPTSTPTPTPTLAPVGSYVDEDFESATNAFASNCNNVAFEGVTGQVGEVPAHSSGSGQNVATLNFTDVSEGSVKVSYDVYLVGKQSHYIKANPVSGKEYPLLMVDGLNLGLTNGGASVYTAPAASWVRIEHLVRMETGAVETRAYSMTGALLLETSNNAGCESIASVAFCNWSASSKMSLYIDNILIENYDAPPEISKAAFTKKDFAGNILAGIWDLTPGIASVSINFGTKMDNATLGGIILKNKLTGATIATSGTLSGIEYILAINEGLEPNSVYQVYVPETVASNKGILLGTEFTYEFETGEGETAISVNRMTKNGTSVTALSQLTAGDTLTVSVGYGNLTGIAIPVTCVVAYYSGKTMTKFEAYTLSAPTGFGLLNQNITAPSLTGVDKIQIVALSDLYGMIAYGAPLIIQ